MSIKQEYRNLCNLEQDIPIFSRDWWLDATAGEDNWDVILVKKAEQIFASLPYVRRKEPLGRIYLTMPRLTPFLGIWIKYPKGQKYATKLAHEKEMVSCIIDQIPDCDLFSQCFHYSFTNWLPFLWRKYQQTTLYSYILEELSNTDKVFKGFKDNIKTDIRKAAKVINVVDEADIEKFYTINKMTFERQGLTIPYELKWLVKLDQACEKRSCRKMFFAEDAQGRIHAAIYIIWDEKSAYYLMGGGDPDLRRSGATSLLLWEAIQFASTVTRQFDFEGSVIEPIERFFCAFGGIQKPYFHIHKTHSTLLKAKSFVAECVRNLSGERC